MIKKTIEGKIKPIARREISRMMTTRQTVMMMSHIWANGNSPKLPMISS